MKKKWEANPDFLMFKTVFFSSPSFKLLWKSIYSPFGFFLAFSFLSIISPVLFLFSAKTLFLKLIGYKSKLEKEAEIEAKNIEEAHAKAKAYSEWFMKNEGRGEPPITPLYENVSNYDCPPEK